MRTECWPKIGRKDGLWLYQCYDDGETFQLRSFHYTGTFALLYEDVTFSEPIEPTP